MLVRKKSGEIVKPLQKRSNSATNVNRSVTFNSFIDIKTFNGTESPISISRKGSTEGSPVTTPSECLVNSPSPFFNDPNPTYEYFIRSNNINTSTTSNNKIFMKSINYYDNRLVGYFNCLNLDYEKSFQLKLTFDKWNTTILFNSDFQYIRSMGKYDEFKFDISLNITKDFEFVLNYKVCNQIHWDNNNCKNYKVSMSSSLVQNADVDELFYDTTFSSKSYSFDQPTNHSYYNFFDTEYVDSVLNDFISNDYNSILQNYCFHSEPSQSYFSLSDEISI